MRLILPLDRADMVRRMNPRKTMIGALRDHYEPFVAVPGWPGGRPPLVWMPVLKGNTLTIEEIKPPRVCEITGISLP